MFLFLSSSGAGETQTALRFVVPLVLSWPRSSPSTRTSCTACSSRSPPRCFIFGLFSLSASRVLSLSLSLSLSLVLGRPLIACRHECIQGGGLQDGAPSYHHDCFWVVLGEEHRTVSRTVCPELSVLPPFPPAVP